MLPKEEAVRLFEDRGQTLKVEPDQGKGGDVVPLYRQDGFADFCLGPHLPSTGRLKHFKLLSVSGLTGRATSGASSCSGFTARPFPRPRNWRGYLRLLEEAKKRDHRRLGQELTCSARPRTWGRADPLASQGRPHPGDHRAILAGAPLEGATKSSIRPTSAAKTFGRPRAI